jgi:hypothetical protein
MQFLYRPYVTEFSPGECIITVLEDSGAVNNPQLDATLNLQVNTTYDPTVVNMNVITTNYTMDFFGTQDGIMSITNAGQKPAYNVQLGGDWLSYSSNGFTLAPGETKGLIFTIKPVITNTSQTNQTFTKYVTAAGNFPSVQVPISVFVNYADISTNATSNNSTDFLHWVCANYPDLCNSKVVYKYINNASDVEVNVSVTQAKLDSIWLYLFTLGDDFKTLQNFVKERDQNMTDSLASTTQNVQNLTVTANQTRIDQANSRTGLLVAIILIALFLAIAVVGALIFVYRKNAEMHRLRRMGLG